MMNKYFLILLLALATLGAKGQGETVIMVNYLPSLSLFKTADFTNGFSPRGVDIEANKFILDDVSVGLVVSWNIFREKITNETFEYKDLTITGTQFRYTNTTPLNINLKKYFLVEEASPYIGFGIGTMYAKRTNEIGVFSISEDKWLFNIAPELGLLYDFGRNSIISFKLKFNYSPEAGDFPSTTYLSFGVGIGMR